MLKALVSNGPHYRIQVFRTGRCRIFGRFTYKTYARDVDHPFNLYINVIRGNGLNIVVDTGMASVAEMNRGAGFLMSQYIIQEPGEDTLGTLAKAGLKPDDIDYVFFTHVHYDHSSAIPLFPRAKVVLPEKTWTFWHDNPKAAGYLDGATIADLEKRNQDGRLQLLDDGLVAPGLGVKWVGGHSVCSQFVYVNTSQGVAVFTGDTIQMYANLEQDDVIGICGPEGEIEARAAMALARQDADIILPSHDPQVLERFPGGIIG